MKKIRLNIDDREVLGLPGQTILEVAKENNENYLTDEEQHKIIIKDYDMLFEYRE